MDPQKLAETRCVLLAQQRNSAMDQVVVWQTETAMLREQVAALTKEVEALKPRKRKAAA